ncbi:hypothetical protein HJ144_18710 [Vibrio parahaemolyticus]|nr:hypothetical protein [Vibrio parahaemolyticus]HCG7440269.1 hypothetical protein [Vibrio parahaemolyticus]
MNELIDDQDWGCQHSEFVGEASIKACTVSVNDLRCMANELTNSVLNTSWITSLDKGTQKSYQYTAKETAEALVEIFDKITDENSLGAEFGEIMVSMGSSRALEKIFGHISLPIAEIWKPQVKQNEGFDFHTECPSALINFGEAKFSGSENPHGKAISQAQRFIKEEKHYRDRVHLVNLSSADAVTNLDDDKFGAIAAFSINSDDVTKIMNNALDSIRKSELINDAQMIYLVGVKC